MNVVRRRLLSQSARAPATARSSSSSINSVRTRPTVTAEEVSRYGPAPKQKLSLRPWIYATVFIFSGLAIGNAGRYSINPPAYPTPGTAADTVLLDQLAKEIDGLDVVKKLRAQGFRADPAAPVVDAAPAAGASTPTIVVEPADGQSAGGWRELQTRALAEAESPGGATGMTRTLTQQTLRGARLLGVQRTFWHAGRREMVAVVWFGTGVCGWPNVAHGGAIATVLEEALARTLAGPDGSLDAVPQTSSFEIAYKAITDAHNFYVVRASVAPKEPDPTTKEDSPKPPPAQPSSWFSWATGKSKQVTEAASSLVGGPDVDVACTMENLEGKVCVKAKATWPSSAVSKLLSSA